VGLKHGKLYQDPLYGAKVLSPLAVQIIDTPEFQRLGQLRQLGFSDLVYRGAHHTRFEHSIGTYFVCRTIMRRIVQNHERLDLNHPGEFLSPLLREVPENAGPQSEMPTFQSLWRGLTEVVSIAALLHDLGHVPFGHTLEDEFAGIFPRHDRLAGPRLHRMLFDNSSDLAAVFDNTKPWVGSLSNHILLQLIYVILNWKEKIEPAEGFEKLIEKEIKRSESKEASKRLTDLRGWYTDFRRDKLFYPFMSDIIGNTICSDLLDYLPRDRTYLGMEARYHSRLQRYFTIREGSLYPNEGLRMSIMVTRGAHGGQRRDVATAVLAIMRERYEMAERVYYHHKKASAGAMLAKLMEITPSSLKPRDDEQIYPAPWDPNEINKPLTPHMTHLSDSSLIEYLGHVEVGPDLSVKSLQRKLYTGLVARRRDMYRTLLVVDCDLGNAGSSRYTYIADELRGSDDNPDASARFQLERTLATAAGANEGEVIIYCPSPSMQSKEVDARLEIAEGRVLPLRVQHSNFTYDAEVKLLKEYYENLWRAYIFVTPTIFADEAKCRAIVDKFCDHYRLPTSEAYRKVRGHKLSEKPFRAQKLPLTELGDKKPAQIELDQLVGAGLAEPSDIEADVKASLRRRVVLRMVLPVLGKERLAPREDKLINDFIQEEILQLDDFVGWQKHARSELAPSEKAERFHVGDVKLLVDRLKGTIDSFKQKRLID